MANNGSIISKLKRRFIENILASLPRYRSCRLRGWPIRNYRPRQPR